MSTHSDGEDSAMHDRDSVRSSTPSTPPAAASGTAAPSSPPTSQHAQPGPQRGQAPTWASKRSTDEAEQNRDKLLDKGWSLKWLGDPLDESDMFRK